MNTFVKDVMTTKVIWVERDTPFAPIAAALREYRVSAYRLTANGGPGNRQGGSDLLAKLALSDAPAQVNHRPYGLARWA
jgi:CBS domain-containing protein